MFHSLARHAEKNTQKTQRRKKYSKPRRQTPTRPDSVEKAVDAVRRHHSKKKKNEKTKRNYF